MIQLLLSGFFLSISFITSAAIVNPKELTESPIQFLEQKKDKTTRSKPLKHITNHDKITKLPGKPIQLLQQEKNNIPHNTQQQSEASYYVKDIFLKASTTDSLQSENSNQVAYDKLEAFAQKLNNAYGDNQLVQQSLSVIYDAKQLWDKTDSEANIFASDIIFSLELDDFFKNDLSNTQQSVQNSGNSGISNKGFNFSNQHYQENNISLSQVQQAQAKTSDQGLNPLISHLLASLFQVSTLYYLLAFSILFMLLQWAIKLSLRFFFP